jgi:hypothetical protein
MLMQLSAAAAYFGLNEQQKDTFLGGYLMAAFFIVGAPAALLVSWIMSPCTHLCLALQQLLCVAHNSVAGVTCTLHYAAPAAPPASGIHAAPLKESFNGYRSEQSSAHEVTAVGLNADDGVAELTCILHGGGTSCATGQMCAAQQRATVLTIAEVQWQAPAGCSC